MDRETERALYNASRREKVQCGGAPNHREMESRDGPRRVESSARNGRWDVRRAEAREGSARKWKRDGSRSTAERPDRPTASYPCSVVAVRSRWNVRSVWLYARDADNGGGDDVVWYFARGGVRGDAPTRRDANSTARIREAASTRPDIGSSVSASCIRPLVFRVPAGAARRRLK